MPTSALVCDSGVAGPNRTRRLNDVVVRSNSRDYQTHYTYERFQVGVWADGSPRYGWRKHSDNATMETGSTEISSDNPLITNADQGAVLALTTYTPFNHSYSHDWDYLGTSTENRTSTNPVATIKLFTLSAGQAPAEAALQLDADNSAGYLQLMLQRADGSYIGNVYGNGNPMTLAFDTSGNVAWRTPGYYFPQIATADGGVIASVLLPAQPLPLI